MANAPSVVETILPLPEDSKMVPFTNALRVILSNINNALRFLLQRNNVAITADYSVVGSDYLILADATSGGVTITLPSVVKSKGQSFVIKKIDSSANTVTIDGAGSETIDESTTRAVVVQYQYMTVLSDGTEWWTI